MSVGKKCPQPSLVNWKGPINLQYQKKKIVCSVSAWVKGFLLLRNGEVLFLKRHILAWGPVCTGHDLNKNAFRWKATLKADLSVRLHGVQWWSAPWWHLASPCTRWLAPPGRQQPACRGRAGRSPPLPGNVWDPLEAGPQTLPVSLQLKTEKGMFHIDGDQNYSWHPVRAEKSTDQSHKQTGFKRVNKESYYSPKRCTLHAERPLTGCKDIFGQALSNCWADRVIRQSSTVSAILGKNWNEMQKNWLSDFKFTASRQISLDFAQRQNKRKGRGE